MKSRCATGKSHCILDTDVVRNILLDFVDIGAYGRYPVRHDGVIYPLLLIAVHSGTGKPYLFLKALDPFKLGITYIVSHSSVLTSYSNYMFQFVV